MRVKAGKARTAPCRLSGWEKNWRVIVLRRLRRNEMLIAQDDDGQGLLGFVEAKKKANRSLRVSRTAYEISRPDTKLRRKGARWQLNMMPSEAAGGI
jgi:hypothetical protein